MARSVADLTDQAVDQVIRAADGNPLLAVESARALAAGRAAPPPEPAGRRRAATGALARPARDLAEMLAAAGRELSAAELAAAYPQSGANRPRRRRGRAVPGHRAGHPVRGGLRFRHALLAEERSGPTWGSRGAATSSSRWPSRRPLAAPDRVAAEVVSHLHRAGRDDLAGTALAAGGPARPVAGRDAGERPGSGPRRCAATPEAAALRLELAEAFGWLGPGRRLRARVAGGPRASSPRNGSRWPGPAAARCSAR